MAYRLHKDSEDEQGQADHSYVSLAGIIKLQPNRRKGNKTWRPMQASDLGEPGSSIADGSIQFNENRDVEGRLPPITSALVGSFLSYPFDRSYTRSSVDLRAMPMWDKLGDTHDGTNTIENFTTFAEAQSDGFHPNTMHYAVTDPHVQLFGRLPDPILLHEQMGKFDGQVVFIGHPNRDVSAHQWSSSSFQWINIGRYAQSRGKVEGSLASDRLRGSGEPHDTLEYFKLAAKNRETLIIENGRPDKHPAMRGGLLHTGTDVASTLTTHSDTSTEGLQITTNTPSGVKVSLPLATRASTKKELLEDSFVAAVGSLESHFKDRDYLQSNLIGSTGSLDLNYQFPTKATTVLSPDPDYPLASDVTERRRTQHHDISSISAPILRDIAFGEEATTQCGTTPGNDERSQRFPPTASIKTARGGQQLPSNVNHSQSTTAVQDGVILSTISSGPAARYAIPARSTASPHYGVSNLSATAVPYASTHTPAVGSGASESNASTVNAAAVGLHYSDPDGLRKTQKYEVANGLCQQAPTLQSFSGPFFTDSKPTAHNPTVALSVRINEEEKLVNWFRDGHRPARQREYTKSLIAAAAASGKPRCFGAIGEASASHEKGPYANTAPFVRLYENLSEYMEEHRNGSAQSYFTRRWKHAPPQYRGSGLHDNMSYFSNRNTAPLQIGGARLCPW